MTYTLKKLELEEGKDSMLPTGYSTRGEFLSLFDYETDEVEHGVELSEVREGWQIILESFRDYHRTSKIREIVTQDENSVVFRTQTSLYELIKHEE